MERNEKDWAVVHIFSGIIETVWIFDDEGEAAEFLEKKMEDLGFIYDSEVGDFVDKYGYSLDQCEMKDEYVLKEVIGMTSNEIVSWEDSWPNSQPKPWPNPCENCNKLGEATCGNDIKNHSCWEER